MGDTGVVVRIDQGDEGVFYTVECPTKHGIAWTAEFSQDELERVDPTQSTPAPEPAGRRKRRSQPARHPPPSDTTAPVRAAAVLVVAGAVGSIAAVALCGVLVKGEGWTVALILGAVAGLVAGLGAGNVVESVVLLVLLSGVVAASISFLQDRFWLSVLVSIAAGLGGGHLVASVLRLVVPRT